jgi:hypothetical protein
MAMIRFNRRGAYYQDGWSVHCILRRDGVLFGEVKRLSEGKLDTFQMRGNDGLYRRLEALLESLQPEGDSCQPLAVLLHGDGGGESIYYLDHASKYPFGSADSQIHAIVNEIAGHVLPVPMGPEMPKPTFEA